MNLNDPPRIALFGAGRVGTAVAELLRRSGCPIAGVWSRSPQSVDRAVRLLGADALVPGEPIEADLILVGAADAAITDVAGAAVDGVAPGTVAAHLSGSLGVSALAPLEAAGAIPVALHPVQACPTVETAIARLPGSAWGITARPDALAWASDLVTRRLGGSPIEVAEGDRPIWHAACVMTSNGIAGLLAFGEALLGGIGMDRPHEILGPLAAGTVANAWEEGGGAATLTGPVVRGEAEVLERHLAALEARRPEAVEDYRRVASVILAAAVSTGKVEAGALQRMRELLG